MPLPIKTNTAVRRVKRITEGSRRAIQLERRAKLLTMPIDSSAVLYESFSGNGMLCHPEALFQYLLKAPDLQHLKHIWVLRDLGRYASTIDRFSEYPRVHFVKYGSFEYYKALHTSRYLINNVSFPQQFMKREGQIYVNTWHGVPLKKMGYDITGKALDARNMIRNFLAADFLLSSGPNMTERMYARAFKLANIFEGRILEMGNPRVDRQQRTPEQKNELEGVLAETGIDLDDREIILYAPTWKGASYVKPLNDAATIQDFVDELEERVDKRRFRVLVKVHQVVADIVRGFPGLDNKLVPNEVPTNLILGATGILITDYSSIFYDFLESERPIIFYTPDVEEYRSYRDVYVDPEEFPGYLAQTVGEVADVIRRLDHHEVAPDVASRYEQARAEYSSKDDGNACARVVDTVFRSIKEVEGERCAPGDGREKILLYAGGMASNGITTSALNLLDNIDYERFDVTVLVPASKDADKRRNARAINENVRVMVRDGRFNTGFFEERQRRKLTNSLWEDPVENKRAQDAIWRNEWRRQFGDAKFDYIVDFCGYSPFWDLLFQQGRAKHYSIWQHNDLAADAERTVAGRQNLKSGLHGVFAMYRSFDSVVSVSPALREVNLANLGDNSPEAQFLSCVNSINPAKIQLLAHGDRSEPEYEDAASGKVSQELKLSNIVDDIQTLSKRYSYRAIRQEVGRMLHVASIVPMAPDLIRFVSVGRLSPEKNHERLIRAFAEVYAASAGARLVIVGEGPLRRDLQALVAELGLAAVVKFAGQQKNPYLIMSRSDCLVVSSDYEGQPMVILEALTLGLPVVTTNFGSASSALPKGSGLIVEQSEEDLAWGMMEFIGGSVPAPTFDVESYNDDALEQFYRAIGATPTPAARHDDEASKSLVSS